MGSYQKLLGLSRLSSIPNVANPFYTLQKSLQQNRRNRILAGSIRQSSSYVEEMRRAWERDPSSVHDSWVSYFEKYSSIPTTHAPSLSSLPNSDELQKIASDHIKMLLFIRSYQVRGHYMCKFDPLGINDANLHVDKFSYRGSQEQADSVPKFLDYRTYGFTEADLEREFYLNASVSGRGGLIGSKEKKKLKEIIQIMKEAYCGTVGVEFTHIADLEQQNWIRSKFEKPKKFEFDEQATLRVLDRLIYSVQFESFLATKYNTTKRFGLEGVDSLIPGMKAMIDTAVELGVESIDIGMPHRGRLNVLANVMRKPLEEMLYEFMEGTITADAEGHLLGSGDVKYHLGFTMDRPTHSNRNVHISLCANPSHLEAVNPIVEGKTRAKQHYSGDTERKRCMSVVLHGDAAFAGQGVVYETLELSDIKGYTTGGTIHIIANNQIGFTTDPRFSRSSPYCTDVAKSVGAPIFHVNGDDPEAVCWVMSLAAEFRQTFRKDVVVDIVGYRRHGHNEIDEPMFTQPLMYKIIKKHPDVLKIYSDKLVAEGRVTREKVEEMKAAANTVFNEAFEKAKDPNYRPPPSAWFGTQWKGYKTKFQLGKNDETAVPKDTLQSIGEKISAVPQGFNIHRKLEKMMRDKRKAVCDQEKGIDWGTAEALAFGSLLLEGTHVRLSGQDVERGTFSHRHAVLHDQKNETKYIPLNNLSPNQAMFAVFNSNLSEYAVLGFELGYAMENPNSLVCWEAQFGDFANTAQVIIDQFISSGEQKWLKGSGLVMLLPHGFEGQGPEHSSARLERYLQMCDDDPDYIPEMEDTGVRQIQDVNMQVVNPSTPANYFHLLRRQIRRDFRKPLICISPKSLLRHPQCQSDLLDFYDNKGFQRVLPDSLEDIVPDKEVQRLILCSGRVYYDLAAERDKRNVKDVAIVRIEQICPFPYDRVGQMSIRYPNAEIFWVQEEPFNQGAWGYVQPRIATALRDLNGKEAFYVGRNAAASPATGSPAIHQAELDRILEDAFAPNYKHEQWQWRLSDLLSKTKK
ncbi:hypothetical protein GUITHDRAFT_141727 [Guillardia theta CCMP2712]|uniref:2-oxoglutarate dehydrogenase, mitochondrial n=2 Tax=Guillardia theta TaxID=55529 RepID=L1IZQ3_GUITC|nr:hypothetical protein GUITHDRAFT_141727 [Guillardia theta CCMP2712]EKX41726.1 hypothetical protein GUITHDRAFT_141727 [Guillardia theta CCMP2712]|eukprot:XP_005828706.1 hypothetical protein GUITHDRAFT_141727 [Guillardia theta CCMP2712]